MIHCLFTEFRLGPRGKYLAQGHGIWTERSINCKLGMCPVSVFIYHELLKFKLQLIRVTLFQLRTKVKPN